MPRDRRTNENLFKDSTMTFGEHLEELRDCLFKSLLGLAIGFVVGLSVGSPVVQIIQKPLTDALTKYYENQATERVEAQLAQDQTDGKPLPGDPDKIAAMIARDHMLAEEVYVDPVEFIERLKANKKYAGPFEGVQVPPRDADKEYTKDDLIRIFLWHPIADDSRVKTKSLNAHEAFMIYIKASLLVGAILASPWIFYQIWAFVAAGLYGHEKQFVHIFLPFSLALFFAGAALAFFFVFEPVLNFLFSFNRWLGIDPDPRISEWLGFVLMLPLGFGVSFQLPLVMLFLERIGIFDVEAYLSRWRIAILVIFTLAMFLTPADPTSMMLMAGPLTVLYFGGILLCHFLPSKRSPYDDDDDVDEV